MNREEIAKDVLCAMIRANWKIDNLADAAKDAAMVADTICNVKSPSPQPSGGPRWRNMDEIPSHGSCVIVMRLSEPHWRIACVYMGEHGWARVATAAPYNAHKYDRWLDIGDFRPTE